jgi:hypothetical protein
VMTKLDLRIRQQITEHPNQRVLTGNLTAAGGSRQDAWLSD